MIKVQTNTVGPIKTNCYLVSDGNNCFLVDPGDNADEIITKIQQANLSLAFILLTHGHFDHVLALQEIINTYPKTKIYLNKNDHVLADNASLQARMFGINYQQFKAKFINVNDGDMIKFGNRQIKVIETPGHTPGSVCYFFEDNLFSGDTLFYGTIGRTDLPGGDLATIHKSLAKLAKLPDNTKVYPGHGPETNIITEKSSGYLGTL